MAKRRKTTNPKKLRKLAKQQREKTRWVPGLWGDPDSEQYKAAVKWMTDNERLGVGYMNEDYIKLNKEKGIYLTGKVRRKF
jgi:hypothetical protein